MGMVMLFTCLLSLKALAIDGDDLPADDVPIDGGLSLLVAAGVGYGIRKVKGNRKK